MNNYVDALTVHDSLLFAGGGFAMAGGKVSGYLGEWAKRLVVVALTGDVNQDGSISTSDVIYLVNFVLKAGPSPLPCVAAGDANCPGTVVTSDIVYLVGAVLKGGPLRATSTRSSRGHGFVIGEVMNCLAQSAARKVLQFGRHVVC